MEEWEKEATNEKLKKDVTIVNFKQQKWRKESRPGLWLFFNFKILFFLISEFFKEDFKTIIDMEENFNRGDRDYKN